MSTENDSTGIVAVLGVGRVGTVVARSALRAGYSVNVASSGGADRIALLVDVAIPGARATTAADAVRDADIVVVAVPLGKFRSVDPEMLVGKVVVDIMNYWPPVDGHLEDFDGDASSSEVVAQHLGRSRLVKTLNHIGYHELEQDAAPGASQRRALAVASDDEDAAGQVATMIDRFGFDPVIAGPLSAGRRFEPGTAIFNDAFTRSALEAELGLSAIAQA
ncbi:hypothetical protein CLV30_11227 [Haloactinopolyspora alba]|uniref:Pyrroline-5-carboxylate reductase catalytic N-terminal domain-containing protein n=1 Tax=Haloactinopolyspora alba TaxID=648780 RepID=A0A2P8DX36_9ACTN|nr:NAD(P)-binding domain-containing protein [Haloactinopolyspora alba]PSL01788.1 hypothetical protein CLV30_11227 [Haloactinopolyspora alba]